MTDKKYWESYYGDKNVDRQKVINICSRYDKYWEMLIQENSSNNPKSLIEIGGYPGRYLAYIGAKYDLRPTSLDFNSDRSAIENTFKLFDIADFDVIQADFLKNKTDKQYDIVISNGFIEHFVNYDEVMDRHIDYLKEGGTLLMMIPNMRHYIYWYKLLVDKPNLDIHNTSCMNLKVFEAFAERNNLKIHHLDYLGGFPYSPHQPLNLLQKIIYKAHRLLFKFMLDKHLEKRPNRFFSSSIIGVFQK
nr:methyltransferase domain-containing protein [Roseivirga sp. E12]